MLAPGKINIALYLGELRADGLHDLTTVTESLTLADQVSVEPAPDRDADEVVCVGVDAPNLAATALTRFRETFGWQASPQRITIEKQVPVAAGMGGGSADAAAVLRLCAQAAEIKLDDSRLGELAWQLGADVPSQLQPGTAFVTAGGQSVEQLPPLQHGVLVVPLAGQLSTAAVFAEADRLGLVRSAADLQTKTEQLRQALTTGALPSELVTNDLEPAACSLCHAIGPALSAVRQSGAAYAFVTGSGPTVVGIFPGHDGAEKAEYAATALCTDFPLVKAAQPIVSDQLKRVEQ